MDNREKELLLEKFEVASRAADDCTYILVDSGSLTKKELENKLYTRLNRIKKETEELGRVMDSYFEKVNELGINTVSSGSSLDGKVVVN